MLTEGFPAASHASANTRADSGEVIVTQANVWACKVGASSALSGPSTVCTIGHSYVAMPSDISFLLRGPFLPASRVRRTRPAAHQVKVRLPRGVDVLVNAAMCSHTLAQCYCREC